jgi:hypothetical protein
LYSTVTVGTKEVEAHLTGLSKVAGGNPSPITILGAAYFSDKNKNLFAAY